ncbi:MAG: sugar O-acyltransferase [Flexibacter sp. CG_4_10_14_3_um_filter_32_15]|nr:MAG: sugar O-acyltransferase [Flexibacter sp. CG_4_10_14_3_um_filter_32_15]
MSKIIIFGTGDIAQIANYYFDIDSEHEVVAFTVNQEYLKEDTFEGKPVAAFEELEKKYPITEYQLFIALSYSKMNKIREEKYYDAKAKGYTLVSYISSKCSYMSQYPCGDNCFIFEDNTIQPFVKLGSNITLWSGNHIGHHSIIHDHNFISSHVVISGHCEIKSNCFLGVNATLHNNVVIEKETLLAAGAIISKNTVEKEVYLPAKSILLGKKSDELNF